MSKRELFYVHPQSPSVVSTSPCYWPVLWTARGCCAHCSPTPGLQLGLVCHCAPTVKPQWQLCTLPLTTRAPTPPTWRRSPRSPVSNELIATSPSKLLGPPTPAPPPWEDRPDGEDHGTVNRNTTSECNDCTFHICPCDYHRLFHYYHLINTMLQSFVALSASAAFSSLPLSCSLSNTLLLHLPSPPPLVWDEFYHFTAPTPLSPSVPPLSVPLRRSGGSEAWTNTLIGPVLLWILPLISFRLSAAMGSLMKNITLSPFVWTCTQANVKAEVGGRDSTLYHGALLPPATVRWAQSADSPVLTACGSKGTPDVPCSWFMSHCVLFWLADGNCVWESRGRERWRGRGKGEGRGEGEGRGGERGKGGERER